MRISDLPANVAAMSAPWEIVPNVGIGPVRFGMTRQEVRAALNLEFSEFKRTPSSKPADKFSSLGAFAGLNLSDAPVEQLLREVRLIDPRAEIGQKMSGFLSRVLGTSIWTEGERSEPPQSVIAFVDGYYD